MAPVTNGQALFNEVPKGMPVPGKTIVYDTSATIDLDNVALQGGALVKTLVLSIDPYLRGKMRDASKESYSAAFEIGKPLNNFGVGVVLRSENAAVKAGDHIYGIFPFQEYPIFQDLSQFRVLENKEKLPWSVYVGAAGMPGQTAFMAWEEYSKAKKGEVAFISTGAGPVGSLVIQIAKKQGLKVIASAGSDEKVEFMKSIGVDVAFNYKTASTRDILKKEGPIDIYWDNVGGETLEAALDSLNIYGRIIACGAISGYNGEPIPIRNLMNVVAKNLTINGFIVNRLFATHYKSFLEQVPQWIANGEVKFLEHFNKGLDKAGEAMVEVLEGRNHGKSVIVVAEN